MLIKQIVPVGVLVSLAPFLLDSMRGLDFVAAIAQLTALPFYGWALALMLTVVSYLAIGRYDGVVHRVLRTGAFGAAPQRAGMVSIALSQTTGFGLIVGTLARWRMLPDCSMTQTFAVTATVSVFFLGGWAVVTAVAVLTVPHGLDLPDALAWLALLGGGGVALCSLTRPYGLRLPSLQVLAALTGWIALDLATAAGAFWLVLPPDVALPFATLLPAFLVAFTLGLLSGSPAGIGPFEICLLALLPHVPQDSLLCGLIAFRMIYFVVPAVIAVIALAMGPRPRDSAQPMFQTASALRPQSKALIARWDGMAERGLVHQGHLGLITDRLLRPKWLARDTGQCLIALQDPLNAHPRAPDWVHLLNAAAEQGKSAFLYKCSPRCAARLRQSGAHVLALSQEAQVDTASYTVERPECRQLRRKLRSAEKAGVSIEDCRDTLPLAELAALDDLWQALHGAAKGFSMGRFCPDYLTHQRVFVALQEGAIIGFVTFHATAKEWTLDLMRHGADLPDGTMHSLVHAGIKAAQASGVARVSLAAVPLAEPAALQRLPKRLQDTMRPKLAVSGLRQFKASFNPHWQTRYVVARNPVAMMLGLWDVYHEINSPAPLPHHGQIAPFQTALNKMMKIMNLRPPSERGI